MKTHVWRGSQKRMNLIIVTHATTPTGNNKESIPWSTAIRVSGLYKGTSILPPGNGTGGTIDSADLAELNAGTLYEIEWECGVPENWDAMTQNQRKNHIVTQQTAKIAEKEAEMLSELDYFGIAFN